MPATKSEEFWEVACEMARSGVVVRQISEELGIEYYTLRRGLAARGVAFVTGRPLSPSNDPELEKRVVEAWKADVKGAVIMQEEGLTWNQVVAILQRNHIEFNRRAKKKEERDELIKKMVAAGLTPREMAVVLGINHTNIYPIMQQLKVDGQIAEVPKKSRTERDWVRIRDALKVLLAEADIKALRQELLLDQFTEKSTE